MKVNIKPESKKNLTSQRTWMRGFFVLFFIIVDSIVRMVIHAISLFQFIYCLLTGKVNSKIYDLSEGLSQYVFQMLRYITYCSDTKPYPFGEWPTQKHSDKKAPTPKTPKPRVVNTTKGIPKEENK